MTIVACWYFAEKGRHWYIYKKHRCGPATEVCHYCGHERAT